MKLIGKYLFLFLVLSSLTLNSSCGVTKQNTKLVEGKKEIVIYSLLPKGPSDYLIEFALGHYDGIQVTQVYFDDNLEKLQNQLKVELMVGEGPDVVCTNILSRSIISSVYKLANSNIFIDLDPYLKADKTYKQSDYNKVIMDSDVFNGKRFFIPRIYNVPALITTKEKLVSNNIKISGDRWSWEDLISTCKDFLITRKDKHQALIYDSRNNLIIDLIANSKESFINYNSKNTKFNSQNFIKLLKDYKNYICPVLMKATDSNTKALFADDNLAVMKLASYTGDPISYLAEVNSPSIYLLPSYGNGGVYGVPQEMYAITAKCKYKQAAYDFIQSMMKSTNLLMGKQGSAGAAVYKPLFNRFMEAAEGKGYISDIGIKMYRPLNSEEKNVFSEIANASEARLSDDTINEMITTAVDKYIKGTITAEQATIEIDRKAKLFLNE